MQGTRGILLSFLALVTAALLTATTVPGGGAVLVTEETLGGNWLVTEQGNGAFAFAEGPDAPPLGMGSLEMRAAELETDKVTLVTFNHIGPSLEALTGLTYWTFRDGISTSPEFLVPSINVQITNGGPDGSVSFATLVWEPVYPFGADAIQDDSWQRWDTMVPSQTNFGGGWWTTRALGDICAFNCFVSWQTVLENNPHARILALGVNLGTGPTGSFQGNVDALKVTVHEATVTYDFEPRLAG